MANRNSQQPLDVIVPVRTPAEGGDKSFIRGLGEALTPEVAKRAINTLIDKSDEGDTAAAALVVKTGIQLAQIQAKADDRAHERWIEMNTLQVVIRALLDAIGPMDDQALAAYTKVPQMKVVAALRHKWFKLDLVGWTLTDEGKQGKH